MVWKEIKDKLTFWKEEEEETVYRYQIKQKPPGGHWKKASEFPPDVLKENIKQELGPSATLDDFGPEMYDNLRPGFTYKCVEIMDERGTHGSIIWGPVTIPDERSPPASPRASGGGSGGPLLDVNAERFDKFKEDVKAIKEVREELNQVLSDLNQTFGGGTSSQGNTAPGMNAEQIPAPQYEGKVPAYLHPAVMNQVKDTAQDVINGVVSDVLPEFKGDDEDVELEGSNFDEKLDDALEE